MEVTRKTAVGLCMLSRGVCRCYRRCEDLPHFYIIMASMCNGFSYALWCVINPPLRSGYACVWTSIYRTSSAANNSGRGSHVLVL